MLFYIKTQSFHFIVAQSGPYNIPNKVNRRNEQLQLKYLLFSCIFLCWCFVCTSHIRLYFVVVVVASVACSKFNCCRFSMSSDKKKCCIRRESIAHQLRIIFYLCLRKLAESKNCTAFVSFSDNKFWLIFFLNLLFLIQMRLKAMQKPYRLGNLGGKNRKRGIRFALAPFGTFVVEFLPGEICWRNLFNPVYTCHFFRMKFASMLNRSI